MTLVERGKVHDGKIELSQAVDLPEGTNVVVRIETVEAESEGRPARERLSTLGFCGMWAGREDMPDSGEWVRKERERWESRSVPQDS